THAVVSIHFVSSLWRYYYLHADVVSPLRIIGHLGIHRDLFALFISVSVSITVSITPGSVSPHPTPVSSSICSARGADAIFQEERPLLIRFSRYRQEGTFTTYYCCCLPRALTTIALLLTIA